MDNVEPSQDMIRKHQDFDALLNNYNSVEKARSRRTRFASALLVGTLLVAGSVFYFGSGNADLVNSNEAISQLDRSDYAIHELDVADIQVPAQNFSLDPTEKQNQILTEQGNTFMVSPEAFVDANGNKISGNVDVKIKEINTPMEMFAENIPNSVMVDGKEKFIEAGKVFEISATQDGKEVFLADGNTISFEIPGTVQGPEYDMYHLEEGEWKSQSLAIAEVEKSSAELQLKIQQLENRLANFSVEDMTLPALPKFQNPPTPLEPSLGNAKKNNYDLRIKHKQFQELSKYESVRWEFVKANEDEIMMSVEWSFLEVVKKNNIFTARFFNKDKQKMKECEITPVFDQDGLAQANQAYSAEMAKVETIKAKQKERLASAKTERASLVESKKAEMAKEIQDLKKQQELEKEVIRALELNGFGLWAGGELQSLPIGKEISISFKNSEGEDIMPSKVFLVERGQNTLFSYSSESFDSFRFNPTKDNLMWTVLAKNKLGIMYPRDFKEITFTTDEHTFKPEEVENVWDKLDDLKSIIHFEEGQAGSN